MRPKILFAIYAIRIKSRKEKGVIKLGEGKIDFYTVFKDYFDDIFKSPQILETQKNSKDEDIPTKKLTLLNAEGYRASEAKRDIVGEFYLGTTDSSVDVLDFESNEPLFSDAEKQNVGYYRRFFFYLYIPKSKTVGYIVIRKVGVHGMKGDFERGVRSWLKEKGYSELGYSFTLNQITSSVILEKLLKTRPMYEFKIIKNTVPASPETTFKKDEKSKELHGKFEVAWRSPLDLGAKFKDLVRTFMKGTNISKIIELGTGIDQEFDELEYQLEIGGKTKKFSLYKEAKMRSDRNVTDDIKYIGASNVPVFESLIVVAKEMVKDFTIKK